MTQITLSVLFRGASHTALPCLEAATQPALDKSFQVTTLGGGGSGGILRALLTCYLSLRSHPGASRSSMETPHPAPGP